jgi:Tectonin domain/Metallo-peptidase family M12B Reprolysin-like
MNRQVLLYTDDFRAAATEVENAGGRPLHVFSMRVFVAALPDAIEPENLEKASTRPPAALDDQERILASSWQSLQQRQASARFALRAESAENALQWDTPGFTPPDHHGTPEGQALLALRAPAAVQESTGTPTSLQLTGNVAVGIISVSGSPWTQVAGKLTWVSVGIDGTVWGVNADDDVFRYLGNDQWETMAGKLKQVSVGGAALVWGVNANDDVFQWTGSGWNQVSGKLKNVSVGSDGAVWGVNSSDDIFRWTGSAWTQIAGKLKQISVADANNVWGVNSADAIFRRGGTTWQSIAGGLKNVSAGYDGSVFGVNASDQVFRYLGNNAWQAMPGALTMISAASTSSLWGVNSSDDVFQGNSASGLDFAPSEITKIVSEVQEGLNFLASAEPLARVTFFYDWHTINVSVTPGPDPAIAEPYESFEAPWRNAALATLGFPLGMQGVVDYVNHIRQQLNTDWAYAGFVTKYPLNWFAYQSGVRVSMSYANDGWGPDRINQVFAHESCHVFGAADEYGSCGCGVSGTFNVANGNCVNCTSSQEACLMNANTLALCRFSRGQIGWSTWAQVSGALKWVSVGSDGTVWGVNSSDDVFRWTGSGWTHIAGKLKQISVGTAARVWGVNSNDDVFQWTGSGWTHIAGKLKNVSVAPDGTVWGVNAADDVFHYLGSNRWQQIGGKLVQVSVASAGTIWGVNANDDVFRYLGNNQWQAIPGKLICVAAASDGTVWGVNRANNIFRYTPATSWVLTPGLLKEISAGSDNLVWGVNGSDGIFRRNRLATP